MLNCFIRGIEFILASPESRVGDFDAITEEDAKLLRELNGNGRQAVNRCIHSMLREVTDRQPDAVALHAWDGVMTYHELDVAASALAYHLMDLGVGPEIMVGICMDKSLWVAVSMLAVLKAGGVVLPLGTQQPMARLQIVLQDTQAQIVLTDAAQMERLAGVGLNLITIDKHFIDGLAPATSRFACNTVRPSNAAWVVYTSGSTGLPKGVVLQHSALCTSIKSHGPAFGVNTDSRVLQFASHTFDVTIQEIFTTLCQGGCVCVPSEDDRVNHLQDFIAKTDVNFLSLTSTVAGLLDPSKLPLIKTVILMGEPVKPAVLDMWKDQAIVLESYAPSECSIYATVSPQPMKHISQVPVLGVPLASCFWVVDPKDYNRLCPIGAPGELLIEGPLLARGYLNDPEKTNKSFLVDPGFVSRYTLLSEPRRMYRTGDLVRCNDDGSYTTLGRQGTQIKIRGQRVEVGEIEYHITRHHSGTEAVVILAQRDSQNPQLVAAFSVPSSGEAAFSATEIKDDQAIDKQAAMLLASEIQLYLSQHVPDYMIPRIWIPMTTLPVNSSGKVDRLSLTKWINKLSSDDMAAFSDYEHQPEDLPATTVEKQLREVWSSVLNKPITQIGYRRSFLSLGGDSITAMQVVSACRALGLTVSVRDILQSPAISELALKVKKSSNSDQHSSEIPDGSFGLSPAQRMFFDNIAASGLRSDGAYRFNQSVCFRLQQSPEQPIQQATIARAVETVVAKHAMLRARFQYDEGSGSWQQRVEKQLAGSYRFQSHHVKDDEEAQNIIQLSQGSLDLEHGPVFAVDFIDTPDRQLLFLTAHHLVIDLMSWRIIAQDMEQLLQHRTIQETSHSLSFPTWSNALIQRASAEERVASFQKTIAPVLETSTSSWAYWGLELGKYVTADQIFTTAELDKQTTDLLLGPVANQALRSEPVDILLAALYMSFGQVFSDRAGPSIFVENHGRTDQTADWDLSDTVGWFTAVTPLNIVENRDASFISVLRQVKDSRKLKAGQQPLDFAVQYSASTGQNLIEVLFNYHGQFQQLDRADGLFSLDKLNRSNASIGEMVKQQAALSLEVSVDAGKLHISLGYSQNSPRGQAIRDWLKIFSQTIADGVSQLMTMESTATISDFPLARLNDADLVTLKQHTGKSWDDIEDVLPCSPIQQGILLSQLKSPETYQLKQTYRVWPTREQPVDVNRLADAWREVVSKHSIMRTIFTGADQERFHQVVLRSTDIDICIMNCSTDSDVEKCIANYSLPDDPMSSRPLHRFLLVTTDEGNVWGHFEISHALVDASSVQLLVGTLLQAYEGLSTAAFPGSNYGTYVSFLEQQSEEEDLQYWTGLLEEAEPCHLQLGQIMNAPKTEDIRVSSTTLQDVSALRNLCRNYSITAANVFQLAWALVLSSYVESDKVCFGLLSSGRDIPIDGVETLVGPMINMMICYLKLDRSMTAINVIRNMQNQFLEGFEHQRASLGDIQHSLQSSQSLFNTTVSYRRTPNMSGTGEQSKSIRLESTADDEPTEYDFNLTIMEDDQDIKLVLRYLPEVATAGLAQRLLTLVKHIVQTLSNDANIRLDTLDLIPEEDHQLLTMTNKEVPTPLAMCIHSLVQKVTDCQPDAVAVHAWDGVMTYHELDVAASSLADYLTTNMGVGPEIMVGICMDKSCWAAVAMLAVLKAGGIVVPLGTQQPIARLQTVTEDTKMRIAIVDATQMERLAAGLHDLQLLKVDRSLLDSLAPTSRYACAGVRPNNAAWVVYTSGSTGVPKGVVLQHSALSTSIKSHGRAFGLTKESRVLQFAAHTFDVTIQEIFTTLCHGGCVCIPSEEDRMNNLEGCILALDVNFLSLTSTVANLLEPARMPLVNTLILIGEPVKPAVLDLWMHRAAVLDAYGPSECSIQSAISAEPMTDRRQATVLGTPLESCCFWVVDPKNFNRLSPIGSPGELLIEGPHLAREYLNDAVKTQASFVVDPDFVAHYGFGSGRRMYRTGDLVRQNEDGTYTNFGRRDTQIKIRGQRVEVGEIEYHISRHPSNVQAVVIFSRHENFDHGQLVAAFSGTAMRDDQTIDKQAAMIVASEIQLYLSQYVPEYMIPRIWIPMDSLPVNTSGKIDRLTITKTINKLSPEDIAALAEYENQQQTDDLPATTVERQLRDVWSAVLNKPVAHISYRRSFLSLGGDSITAMQVVSACRRLGLTISVRDILQSPAISELALKVKKSTGEEYSLEIPEEPFDLSPAQRMFFDDIAPAGLRSDGQNRFNQSVCFKLQQPTQQATLARAIESIVAKHPMLRARFQRNENHTHGWQQRIEKQLVGSHRFQTHQVKEEDDEAAQDIMRTSQSSLDLENGPVFAADFIETPDRQLLFLTAHHLVIDLMSWRIIAQDLEQLLQHRTIQSSQSLPFPSWCTTLMDKARTTDTVPPVVEKHSSSWNYWGLELGQYITADQIFNTAELDRNTTALLLGPANVALRSDPVDILLAALHVSFRDVFTDRSGPSVFIENHGRNDDSDRDLSETVGWFTTVTPMRLSEQKDVNFMSALRQVKDLRKLNTGSDPLEFAVQSLTNTSQNIEVLFNYHGQFQQLERPGGLLALDRLHQPVGQSDAAVGGNVKQHAALNIEVSVDGGKARISLGFSRHSSRTEEIQQWLNRYSQTITEGVNKLMATELTATISDFPLARLSDDDLTTLNQHCLTPAKMRWEDVEDVLPCSPIQQGILLSQLKSPTTYQLKQTCRILPTESSQPVDINRLTEAWREVLHRHSIMRTIFTGALSHHDGFYQVVLKSPEADISFLHCHTDAEVEKCVEAHSLLDNKLMGPPHRFLVITTDEGSVYAHFEISHALVDASSVQLLVDTLLQAYEGTSTTIYGSKYSTYVSFLENQSEEEDLVYWKGLLGAAEPCHLQLGQNGRVASAEAETTHEVTAAMPDVAALRALSRTHNVTAANVFQLAWALVVSSYVEMDQVCFGYLSSGRDVPIDGVDTLVGPMINMMICRVQLNHSLASVDVLRDIQNQFVEGFEHQRASLASIQHSLQNPQQSLFNTTVSYRKAPNMNGTGEHKRSIQLESTTADESTEYDFNLSIMEGELGIELVLQYLPAVATSRTAQRLLTQLKHVVQMLSQNPTSPLQSLDLVPMEDKLAIKSTNQQVPAPVATCIHSLVQEVTDRQPNAPAIYAWDGVMTFSELDIAASTLAEHLTSLGVGPEVMVGICMDKSIWVPVAMLAVLKAGGVVLPLGTQQPLARVQTVLQDTKSNIVLVDTEQMERLANPSLRLIKVDRELLNGLEPASRSVSTTVRTDNAAWVVYTSGSTGTPKGVVLQHSALCSSIKSHGPAFGVNPQSRVLQFASHTFDVTIQEVFTTLCQGGCVCIPSEDQRLNHLQEFIAKAEVNFLSLTSTVAGLLDPSKLPLVTTVILMGEPVKPAVMDMWKDQATVLESYAPSECSIYATVSPTPMKHISQVPVLGIPLSSCFWIVDTKDYNRLLPIGAPGELLIEGPLLARGYLNDPVKTQKSFITDPGFIAELGLGSGRRMYRTGDLVRQNEDGSYTTLGRRDTQVKIRGQRVEVGEIEYWTVRSLPIIHSAAAMLIRRDDGQTAALVVAVDYIEDKSVNDNESEDGLLTPTMESFDEFEQVRSRLMEKIPRYMVPEMFIPMARLPLNSSGKLDRRAIEGILKNMSKEKFESYRPTSAVKADVSTEDERQLQKLWSEVLGRPANTIGAKDNFFHMGGDSITAMRLVEASRSINMSIRVADVFEHPRLSELASVLGRRAAEEGDKPRVEELPPFALWAEVSKDERDSGKAQALIAEIAERCEVKPEQIEDVYPCTPLQEGLLLTTTQQPSAYISRRVFTVGDEIDVVRLQEAWQKMADVAPILRTRILLGRSSGSVQVVVNAPLTWKTSTSLDTYLEEDRALGMAEGHPLVRFGLVVSPTGERLFVWTAHHSVYDGWSLLSMYQQVAQIYWEDATPRSAPYTPFIDYLSRADEEKSADYWREQLKGDLTADFPPLPNIKYQPRPTQRLTQSLEFVRRAKSEVSLSNLLRAAWSLVVMQSTGSNDVVFAVALAGRNAPVERITEILAPTIATVPVRIHADPSSTAGDFLRAVQQQANGMMPFEHTGLQRIRELAPELAAALDLRHLFVVQPGTENGDVVDFKGLVPQPDTTEEFDSYALTVECSLGPGSRISVEARFDDAVIPTSDVQRMLDYFAHLAVQLEQAECTPEAAVPLSDMEPLTTSDLEQIRAVNSHPPPALEACVHQLVLQVAAQQPDAPAVSAWDGDLSYAELEHQSAQLAHLLIGLGVGPEVAVGVCMNKSKWATVSMLAILRAGGIVVPLGIQLPLERIELIIRDSSISTVLADEEHTERLSNLTPRKITVSESLLSSLPTDKVFLSAAAQPQPRNAAWYVYTSGSTGLPKGVVLEHVGICTSIKSQGAAFGLGTHSRGLQFAAHTFDATIQEIFATLCHGGCVCVPSEEERMSDLEQFIISKDINFLSLTSTVAELLNPAKLPKVKTIDLLGEAVKPAVLDMWMGSASVVGGYGPTECSIYSAITLPMTDRKKSAVLGAPLPSCCFWVVDPQDYNRLCPIGTPGELLIEGPHVGRGYLNDEAKTRSAFVVDPGFINRYGFGLENGRRMYRTGDLVVQNPDGTYTYLGRRDTQIKIRGQRVEVGEIEYWAVESFPEIRSAAAMLVSPKDSQAAVGRLAVVMEFVGEDTMSSNGPVSADGLLTPSTSLLETFEQIRNRLREVVPRYMVPDFFIPMAHLPLNSSGKLDRRAIGGLLKTMTTEELERYRPAAIKADVTTDEERQLQKLWSEVLRRPTNTIGAEDNFFQIGGDSITAIQLVAAARAVSLKLTVLQVFQNPVLRDLCKQLDHVDTLQDGSNGQHRKELDQLTRDEITGMLPNYNVQSIFDTTDFQAMVVRENQDGRWSLYITIAYNTKVDKEAVRNSFQQVVEANEILRTTFVQHGGLTYQVVLDGFISPFEEWKTSVDLSKFCTSLIEEDQRKHLKPSEPSLKSWFVQGEDKDSLIIRLSHAQYDGLSLPVFIQQLHGQDYSQNTDIQPRQMSYYVDALTSMNSKPAIDFWSGLLNGSSLTALPAPISQQKQELAGSFEMMKMPAPTSNRSGYTFMTYLKAAWAMALSKASGSTDIVFGQLISGRSMPLDDIDKVRGPCVNLIPVRVNTEPTEDEVLQQISEQQISALPHENLGFETIFKECTTWPVREGQTPRFSTILQYQNLPEYQETVSMHGADCKITYDIIPPDVTDIWLTVVPTGNELQFTAGYAEKFIDSSVVKSLLEDLRVTLESMQNRLLE
jgi:amino acid adenylation domain-containing protein